jgi:hypothetical protein
MEGDETQFLTLQPKKRNSCYTSKACTGKGTQAQPEDYFDSVWNIGRNLIPLVQSMLGGNK